MAIKLNSQGKPLQYDKTKCLEKLIPLILEKAPKQEIFAISDLKNDLNLSDEEKRILVDLSSDIRTDLIDKGLAILKGSRKLLLTEKKYKSDIIMNDNSVNNDFSNSTIGTVIQDSDLNKARIKSNPKTANNTPLKKSLIQKLISNPWILLIVGVIIAAIFNSDRIMNFINKHINNI
jgi:hypothetical protein